MSDDDSCDARVVPIDSVSLRNILKHPAITVHEVEQLLPDLMMDEGWGTVQKSLAKTIAVTRCIDGDSLRTDCKTHSRGRHLQPGTGRSTAVDDQITFSNQTSSIIDFNQLVGCTGTVAFSTRPLEEMIVDLFHALRIFDQAET